jgi:two-component system heavy metal sensor histidine kinase CusS
LIRETANRIGSDNLSERILVPDVEDEITDLVKLLNLMFDRLEVAFNQVRRFASEASHELKTPLSLMRLHAEKLLADEGLTTDQSEALLELLEELLRLNLIIDELLFLSRAEAKAIQLQLTAQNPSEFLAGFQSDAQELAEHYGCRFEFQHQGGASVAFEAKWLRQVLFNLLSNALAVSPEGGVIALNSRVTEESWQVFVEDQGPGLTAEQRDQMFEPFVRFANRARAEDRGSGLGLTICRSLIALHNGAMRAEPGRDGSGLRVSFEIPRA